MSEKEHRPAKALLQAAHAFREVKPWQYIDRGRLFAVRYGDGQTGYCQIIPPGDGRPDTPGGLKLYMEGNQMASFQRAKRTEDQEDLTHLTSTLMEMEYFKCEFVPKSHLKAAQVRELEALGCPTGERGALYPAFCEQRMFMRAAPVEGETDAARLRYALYAATYAGRRYEKLLRDGTRGAAADRALGFDRADSMPLLTANAVSRDGFVWSSVEIPQSSRMSMEAPVLANEEILRELAERKTKRSMKLYCRLCGSYRRKNKRSPYYEVELLIVEPKRREYSVPSVENFYEGAGDLIYALVDVILQMGKPEEIVTCDAVTYLLLASFAAQCGIPMRMEPDCEVLRSFTMMHIFKRIEG